LLLLFIGTCCVNSSVCCAGELGDGLTLPVGGKPQMQESEDSISLLKDPYAALLEQQDPFRHAARKAIALLNGSRVTQYMSDMANMSSVTDANILGIGIVQDSRGKKSDEGSLDGARKTTERHQRKRSATEVDKDDDVAAPQNPVSLLSCLPPSCRSESTSALSKLAPLLDK
jgi:hypothetical protein